MTAAEGFAAGIVGAIAVLELVQAELRRRARRAAELDRLAALAALRLRFTYRIPTPGRPAPVARLRLVRGGRP